VAPKARARAFADRDGSGASKRAMSAPAANTPSAP
jgi:hypothetical protein